MQIRKQVQWKQLSFWLENTWNEENEKNDPFQSLTVITETYSRRGGNDGGGNDGDSDECLS